MTIPHPIGPLGVAAYLTAYPLLRLTRFGSHDWGYLMLNAAGSALILVSLFCSFNRASFVFNRASLVAQTAWLVFAAV